ncbi:MAG: SDR family oxidoreductase [Polyangiaceae bacterium]
MSSPEKPPAAPAVDAEALTACVEALEALVENRGLLAELDPNMRQRLLVAAGRVSRPERNEQRVLARALRKQRRRDDREALEAQLEQAPIRKLREQVVFITPPALTSGEDLREPAPEEATRLHQERVCYVCKQPYQLLHHFYDQLCPECGDFNFAKRTQRADLAGRTALITGARVKIGYQGAILLLRSGARVIVTTRFPKDAARRYAREADFGEWGHRLTIYGLDLRHTPSVEAFARHLERSEDRLDFILHNACQTVRRPPGFYQHLLDQERADHQLSEAAAKLLARAAVPTAAAGLAHQGPGEQLPMSAALTQLQLVPEDYNRGGQLFPAGQLDQDEQQIDLREVNSWRLPLHQVSTVELLEVQLVNAIAPFVLNARLKPLMEREPSEDKHIVNVSAVEGQFYRRFKTDKHPHTNMAKAALNMMTRTAAADYIKSGIHMNSVDTGWVTDEDPAHIAQRKRAENGFHPPLDIVDGAARIVDPIIDGINTGEHVWGRFLKDYRSVPW